MNSMDENMEFRDNEELWDNRELGASEEHAVVAEVDEVALDRASGVTLISIRMPVAMIDDLKFIASRNNEMKYQTLIKQVLARFIESEQKLMWNEMVAQKKADEPMPKPKRRAAG
jgi:predicted DNA binding CopG/RHH family protein